MTREIRSWGYLLGGLVLAGSGLDLIARSTLGYPLPDSDVNAALLLVQLWLGATILTIGGYWVSTFDYPRRGESSVPLHGPRTH